MVGILRATEYITKLGNLYGKKSKEIRWRQRIIDALLEYDFLHEPLSLHVTTPAHPSQLQ